jgi:hypothetical protein
MESALVYYKYAITKSTKYNCSSVDDKLKHLNEVRISENEEIASYLYKSGILIISFYYPSSTKKINRIVLNANHTKKN